MKRGVRLYFVFLLLTVFGVSPCMGLEAQSRVKSFDVDNVLRGKTFFIVELVGAKKEQGDYHAYFQDDGIVTIKFSPKHWKYERWEVDDKGTLCMTTIAKKVGKTTLYTSKCGRFLRESATNYRWYNGDGQHRANFSLKGEGDRLPGFGLEKALDADTVFARERATITAHNLKIRVIRPRIFKSKK